MDLLSNVLDSAYATQVVNEYSINALMKLTSRLTNQAQIDRIRRILQSHTASLDVEIQQRAVEYNNMFGYDEVRRQVLEDMPAPQIQEESRVLGEAAPKPKPARRGKKQDQESALLDLMSDDGPSSGPSAPGGGNADLLQSILGGMDSGPGTPSSASPAPGQQKSSVSNILDLFDSPAPAAPQNNNAALLGGFGAPAPAASPAQAAAPPVLSAYSKNDLDITLQLQRTADGTINVLAKFRNTSLTEPVGSVNLQAAVPKSQKLQLQPISTSDIGPGGDAQQMMRILGAKAVSSLPPGSSDYANMCSHLCDSDSRFRMHVPALGLLRNRSTGRKLRRNSVVIIKLMIVVRDWVKLAVLFGFAYWGLVCWRGR